MLGATCHELDLQPLLENAVHYTDQNDHAQIRIVPAIHEHSLQRRCAIALRCRDLRDDLFEYLVNADAGFGGSKHHLDRKSVVKGTSVSVRVDLGGRRIIKKKHVNKENFI